jgi:hypothetical protein
LNEPVRCRFSVFISTVPPVRAERKAHVVTGVCLTMPAPAARARSMRAGSIVEVTMRRVPYRPCAHS